MLEFAVAESQSQSPRVIQLGIFEMCIKIVRASWQLVLHIGDPLD